MATDVLTGPTILGTATRTRVYKNFIDGEWVESASGQTFEDRNPADTREVVAIFQRSNKADVDAAVDAAKRAYAKWRLVPAPRRAERKPDRFRVGAYGSDAGHRPELPPIAVRRAIPFFGREPAGAEVVIIGDTPADITCGSCIKARAVAVATGSYSVTDLAACAPHAVFENFRDTERVLEAILC